MLLEFSSKPKLSPTLDSNTIESKPISKKKRNTAYVLAKFALQLMRVLHLFNEENFKSEGRLRVGEINNKFNFYQPTVYEYSIGISHGKVMAGVVGSSKPLYDVWGNAVNMAARMDSTGLPDNIQITEETAFELREFGLHCDYRGETFVKGRGPIPTYFLGIEDKCTEFMRFKVFENTAL